MIKTVKKRDGRTVQFDKSRIVNAILQAMSSVNEIDTKLANTIADDIAIMPVEEASVEQIQDMVENHLMAHNTDVARSYIKYRQNRTIARQSRQGKVFASIVAAEANDVTRENANMNADTPAGMMMKFASETSKSFTDDYLLNDAAREAVKNNYLHIHDKDYYPTKSLTCCQHPLDKILNDGFVAGHGESRPAKRIETASILACISLETCQNEQHTLNCAA